MSGSPLEQRTSPHPAGVPSPVAGSPSSSFPRRNAPTSPVTSPLTSRWKPTLNLRIPSTQSNGSSTPSQLEVQHASSSAAEVRQAMPVFVDQDEQHGMPSLPPPSPISTKGLTRTSSRKWPRRVEAGSRRRVRAEGLLGKFAGLGSRPSLREEGEVDPEAVGLQEMGSISRQTSRSDDPNDTSSNRLLPPFQPLTRPELAQPLAPTGILSSLLALQNVQTDPTTPSAAISLTSALTQQSTPVVPIEERDDEEARVAFLARKRLERSRDNEGFVKLSGSRSRPDPSSALWLTGVDLKGKKQSKCALRNSSTGPSPTSDSSSRAKAFPPRASSRYSRHASSSPSSSEPEPRPAKIRTTPSVEPGHLSQRPEHLTFSQGLAYGFESLAGTFGVEVDHRPEPARSSAGVFGALIASTAGMAAVAAPHASRLAPAAHRPGFHVSLTTLDVPTSSSPPTSPRPIHSRHSSSATLLDSSGLRRSSSSPSLRSLSDSYAPAKEQALNTLSNPLSSTANPPHPNSILSTSTSFAENASRRRANFTNAPTSRPKPLTLTKTTSAAPSTPSIFTPTPDTAGFLGGYFGHKRVDTNSSSAGWMTPGTVTEEDLDRRDWEKEKKKRKKLRENRKAQEVFIVQHVASILGRQDFIMKLARSFMMFGAPSHRLEAQIQATARVLNIPCQVVYLPSLMLISFADSATRTSDMKFLKQPSGLDLDKLSSAHQVYLDVIHDRTSADDASLALDVIMTSRATYRLWENLVIGALASAFIQPSAFYGSFMDCLISMPLGAFLVAVQILASKNDMYAALFEIVIAGCIAFLSAALASSGVFCFSAVASGSVVLILPGYIVLTGALELANRSIISGSVRLVYACLYSLFLGFGLAIGSTIYTRVTGSTVLGDSDYTCSALRVDAPWYRATISPWWYFLSAPCYVLALSLRNGQRLFQWNTLLMVIIGCAGFAANYFAGKAFPNQTDISSAIGSFVVGLLGAAVVKILGSGSAFILMVAGILFQLPSGLSNGGLLKFAFESNSGSKDAYSSGFDVAEQLISVAIGLTVGLFTSAAIIGTVAGRSRRGANLSSF